MAQPPTPRGGSQQADVPNLATRTPFLRPANMPPLPPLPSFRRQQLLLEYAVVKSKCPEGLYLSPHSANPATWSGVLFVREGPYSSAILRFELNFPTTYPEHGPLVNFSTEMFHPLLVPLTTYTFAAGALDPNATLSSNEAERLQPGSFNLSEAFPTWYPTSSSDKRSARSLSIRSVATGRSAEDKTPVEAQKPDLPALLHYIKDVFDDATVLDNVPLRAAVNVNAWHAWRAHRGLPKLGSRSISPASAESGRTPMSPRLHPGDWNWDGVWESRVKNGIEESMSDAVLFSSKNNRQVPNTSGPIKFSKIDDDKAQDIQEGMMRATGLELS